MKINDLLIKFDTFADYIPIVSTATNLVDLFLKRVYLPKHQSEIGKNRYFEHLDQKSFTRCILLLFPIIGNVFFIRHDFSERKYNS